jgi:glycosyltransferase involved in cell wall biosynthesis
MNITAISPGYNEPSSRFRIRQYIPHLKEKNIFVHEFWSIPRKSYKLPGALGSIRQRYILPLSGATELIKFGSLIPSFLDSFKADLVWMNRPAHNLIHFEKYYRKPVIFDVDDAIWLYNEKKMEQTAKNVSCIIAGNEYIGEWFSRFNKNIFIVPTAVDTCRFISNPSINKEEKFIIGWSGSKDGLRFVYAIEEQLNGFIRNHKNTFIKIICDCRPDFKFIPPERTIYIKWNPLTENTELQDLSVGIMPLTDNEWSRGKCSFKMLQYMSMAIPVVVSDVGMNSELLAKSKIGFGVRKLKEWQEALTILLNDQSLQDKMGNNGRTLVENEYSVKVVVEKLIVIFTKSNILKQ